MARESAFTKYARKDVKRDLTNILMLDILLGGGFPKGDFIELCSDSGVGKTTIALQIARNYLREWGWVLVLDFEQGITSEILEGVGLTDYVAKKPPKEGEDSRNLVITQPITYSDGEYILDEIAMRTKNYPSFIIVDSLTNMLLDRNTIVALSDKEIKAREKAQAEGKGKAVGAKARSETEFLNKYKGFCRQMGIPVLFINQIRTKFTPRMMSYTDSAGSNALRFLMDIRLYLTKKAELMRKEKTVMGEQKVLYGYSVQAMAKKNRGERSHIPVMMDIIHGKGISNYKSIGNLLLVTGLVIQRGAYFYVGDTEEKYQGWSEYMGYIREHAKELKELVLSGQIRLTEGEVVQ